ncbi:hypothetical protein J4442_04255 [Candidatus Woesearchaeota archaeon]|nr:hypothetical protein [Candidatus Woesearchaeota archaeon]
MNLNKLPWWKTDYKSNKRMNCDFFEYLNNKEFLERLNKFPLTKYLTISFLDKHVSRINFIKLTTKKFEGSISRTDPWNSFNFEIIINSNNPLKEKASTLIHECMHGIYRVVGIGDDSTIEKKLCEYESDFYNKNKEFSTELYKKYFSKR